MEKEFEQVNTLKDLFEITYGNLLGHLTAFEKKEDIQIKKKNFCEKSKTNYQAIEKGTIAFKQPPDNLESLIKYSW
jgi:Winged helix DNA-binding domain